MDPAQGVTFPGGGVEFLIYAFEMHTCEAVNPHRSRNLINYPDARLAPSDHG
jgi:hypothetical protein